MRLDGTVLGKFGRARRLLKEVRAVNFIDCRSENTLLVGELANRRVQKLVFQPIWTGSLSPTFRSESKPQHGVASSPSQHVAGWQWQIGGVTRAEARNGRFGLLDGQWAVAASSYDFSVTERVGLYL